MSLSKKIAAALDENTKAYVLPCAVTVEDSRSRLTLNLTALDTVGLAFTTLEFATTSRPEWSSEALKDWGDRLAGRVTYLMEPLKVLEVDAGGGEVQIRSQSPTASRRPSAATTRCASSGKGALRMERFAFDEATRQRAQVPCQLTREVLERLADDIAASAVARLTFRPIAADQARWRGARSMAATSRKQSMANPPTRPSSSICSKPFGAPRRCSPPCRWESSTRSNRVPSSLAALAESLKLDADALERLLDACVGLQVLTSARVALREHAGRSAYLCKQSPSRMTGYLNYSNEILWKMWGNLEDAVREGTNRWQQTFGWDGPIFSSFFQTEAPSANS